MWHINLPLIFAIVNIRESWERVVRSSSRPIEESTTCYEALKGLFTYVTGKSRRNDSALGRLSQVGQDLYAT